MAETSTASKAAQWGAIAAAIGTGIASLWQSMDAMPERRTRPAIVETRRAVADHAARIAVLEVRIEYLERARFGGQAKPSRSALVDVRRRARAGALADIPSVDQSGPPD